MRRIKISDAEWSDRKSATNERQRTATRQAMTVRWHTDPSFREARRIYMNNRRAAERRVRDENILRSDIQRIRTVGIKLKRSHHKICPVVRLYSTLLAEAEIAARAARQSRRDPSKIRNNVRNWKRQNPAAVSSQRFRRRVNLQNAAVVDLTETQWLAIKVAYRHRCAYCGEKKPLTQDHVIPVSKGGAHTASNIVPACQSCNSSKGARLPLVTYQPHLIA